MKGHIHFRKVVGSAAPQVPPAYKCIFFSVPYSFKNMRPHSKWKNQPPVGTKPLKLNVFKESSTESVGAWYKAQNLTSS